MQITKVLAMRSLSILFTGLAFSSVIAMAQNPLNFDSAIRTADPSAHVWQDGRLYLYTSHD